MEPIIFFQNFEHDNNLTIAQRNPGTTVPTSGEQGCLDMSVVTATNQYYNSDDLEQPGNQDITSFDLIMDVEYLPVPAQTNTTVYTNIFGLNVYRGLRFLLPAEYADLGIDPSFGESPTPRRATIQLYMRKVNDTFFLTCLIDGQVAYENARITRNPITATVANQKRINILSILNPQDLLKVYKVALVVNHDKMMQHDTLRIFNKDVIYNTQDFVTEGGTLEEGLRNSELQEVRYVYTGKPYGVINVDYTKDNFPVFLKSGVFSNVPGFYSIDKNIPQYVESLEALSTVKSGEKITVEVARPMVLRYAAGTGDVTVNRGNAGYNFATQRGTSLNQSYNAYNPATGQSITFSGTTVAITDLIGNDGGIIHIYPTDNYHSLTNVLTITDTTHRLVEIIDFGTVGRRLVTNNTSASNNLVKLPSYLPMVINNLESFIRYTAITSSEDIQYWDTSRVGNFNYVFQDKTLDFIPNWDYYSATNMLQAFQQLTANAGDINITNKVVNLGSLCNSANLPNTNITIDAPNATAIYSGFRDATVKSIDLNLVNVTTMNFLFFGTFNTQSLLLRNTKFLNLTTVSYFAQNNTNFNYDLSSWCVPNVTTTTNFDAGATSWLPEHKPKWGTCPE